jgi:hypothetical protein
LLCWSASGGHDGITDELLDAAFITPDDLGGQPEDARHDLARLLRIELLADRGEAGQVAEQDAHLLASGACLCRSGPWRQRPRALIAKARRRSVFCIAGRATQQALKFHSSGYHGRPRLGTWLALPWPKRVHSRGSHGWLHPRLLSHRVQKLEMRMSLRGPAVEPTLR